MVVQLLVKSRANVLGVTALGNTPYNEAQSGNHIKVLGYLLTLGLTEDQLVISNKARQEQKTLVVEHEEEKWHVKEAEHCRHMMEGLQRPLEAAPRCKQDMIGMACLQGKLAY